MRHLDKHSESICTDARRIFNYFRRTNRTLKRTDHGLSGFLLVSRDFLWRCCFRTSWPMAPEEQLRWTPVSLFLVISLWLVVILILRLEFLF